MSLSASYLSVEIVGVVWLTRMEVEFEFKPRLSLFQNWAYEIS